MYQIEEPKYFILLIIIPVIWGAYFYMRYWQKQRQKLLIDPHLFPKIVKDKSRFKPFLKLLLLSFSLLFLITALTNPKMGTKLETVKRQGVDIVFAIDVSKSMDAEDVAPSRLEKAKRLVSKIIDNLISDRIGIIAYAGEAYPLLPITTDYAAGKIFLQNMNSDLVSSQGTAINDAIELATTYFDDDDTNKILMILSDGEDHSQQAIDAAKSAAQQGVTIFSIGVGTHKGSVIPIKRNGNLYGYKKDKKGQTVITRLDDKTLSEIAKITGGKYIDGINTKNVVNFISDALKKMDKKEFETTRFSEYKDQFQWFLAIGLLFLFLYLIILERETQWLRKLNLFGELNNQ
jgi:Ca-activated chloride channel family protein